MKRIILLIFSCIIVFKQANAQKNNKINVKVEIVNNKENQIKSSSEGDKLIEVNDNLFNIIEKITKISTRHFKFEKKLKNPFIKFKAYSDEKLKKESLIVAFFLAIEKELNIIIKIEEVNIPVRILFCSDKNKLDKCSEKSKESSVVKINRTLKGRCISSQKLVDIINDWFGEIIVNELDKDNKFNFEIFHANNLSELLEQLAYDYSINVKMEKRPVKKISITLRQ